MSPVSGGIVTDSQSRFLWKKNFSLRIKRASRGMELNDSTTSVAVQYLVI